MRRRDFIAGVIGLPAAWPLATSAQQGAKLPRVASLVSATPAHPFAAAIGRGLQGLGYTDGRNIALEFHYSEGRRERAAGDCR